METAKVFFTNLRTSPGNSLLKKLRTLIQKAGIGQIDFEGKFTAIKIHFGEPGNLAYIRPNYAGAVTEFLQEKGARVFLTDSNTLYKGLRSNAVDHLKSATENGFNPLQVKCNVIIADGLRGTDYTDVAIEGARYCPAPKIGRAIADADIIITMNHFKGHEQAGFGGALKNIGMGSASIGGKLELHSSSQPKIEKENCRGCNICVRNCNHGAIGLGPDRKAVIDYALCVGCGQCVALCQFEGAVLADYNTSEELNYKIDEYSKAVLQGKPNFHISFIMNVSPECDCWGHNDAAIVPDLGILASFDPVALDQACVDMVTAAPALRTNNRIHDLDLRAARTGPADIQTGPVPGCASDNGNETAERCDCPKHIGEDKFTYSHPDTNWEAGLRYAEEIGLGSRKYELIEI